ncbi:MAG TPA: DEAD/DEAH box helicase, partial [Solirubrobacteraceae bacterium]
PRRRPGARAPLWQLRKRASDLLAVAARYGSFPIILETYRECLRDVLDLPGLTELLRALHRRELTLVEAETKTASPFASSLLFDYVATYMYEGDTPNAERRAAALSLDRELLRELLGQEELRELIDPGALQTVEDDLQHRSTRTQATSRDALHDVLRRLGDLTADEARARVLPELDAAAMLSALEDERRAVRVRVGGEERWIAADDAGLYRDALGVVPQGGLPAAFLEDVPDALRMLVARFARTHGPFTTAELRERYRVDVAAPLRELERDGELVRGELRPGGTEREWCDPEVLRRLRRASLAVLRQEIEAADPRALATFLPSWQGVDRHPAAGAGVDRLREVLVPLQGLALPVEVWERDVLPRRVGAYSPTWLDQLCASGEVVWVGAGSLGRSTGRVALYFREDAEAIGPPPQRAEIAETPEHTLLRERLAQSPCFFTDLLAELDMLPEQLAEVLWDLVWAGEATNDAWAPLRAPRLTVARARPSSPRAGRRFGSRRGGATATVQGRWALTSTIFRSEPEPGARRRTLAELLLERYGIVTREQVLAEGIPGGFAILYDALSQLETLGVCRRGYFIEGLGGAQFALPSAIERLRAQREEAPPIVLAATDPAQPYGAALKWPPDSGARRVRGAYVVLGGGEPVVYAEKGGRSLLTFTDDARLRPALEALAHFITAGRGRKLALERVDGEPVVGSDLEPLLIELGFRAGPRKLTLSA